MVNSPDHLNRVPNLLLLGLARSTASRQTPPSELPIKGLSTVVAVWRDLLVSHTLALSLVLRTFPISYDHPVRALLHSAFLLHLPARGTQPSTMRTTHPTATTHSRSAAAFVVVSSPSRSFPFVPFLALSIAATSPASTTDCLFAGSTSVLAVDRSNPSNPLTTAIMYLACKCIASILHPADPLRRMVVKRNDRPFPSRCAADPE